MGLVPRIHLRPKYRLIRKSLLHFIEFVTVLTLHHDAVVLGTRMGKEGHFYRFFSLMSRTLERRRVTLPFTSVNQGKWSSIVLYTEYWRWTDSFPRVSGPTLYPTHLELPTIRSSGLVALRDTISSTPPKFLLFCTKERVTERLSKPLFFFYQLTSVSQRQVVKNSPWPDQCPHIWTYFVFIYSQSTCVYFCPEIS